MLSVAQVNLVYYPQQTFDRSGCLKLFDIYY
jgi:hypothetical protein